ncbi:uncharacterized protein LOC126736017 [Anthonomus grandis grandis]|uniref:uncharacterized protein LOC126736017 n=1 Tax=Anthonomus grandis grandis TaxID=2921223 RepID=UPI0021656E2F|nr:uncharacterized protein LOC126736017 [Anthonomus grandis grandis]
MDNVRDIVNAAQLPRFLNKRVSIVGNVQGVDPSGKSFTLMTTDDATVKVNVTQITGPISGWVEVHGISRGKEILADNYIIFNNENFDSKSYNELCKLLYSVPDIWKTSNGFDDGA